MLKLMLYTILNIHGRAASYKIFYNLEEDKYLFKPADSLSFELPAFITWRHKGHWLFEGLNDPTIQKQALEDIINTVEMKSSY